MGRYYSFLWWSLTDSNSTLSGDVQNTAVLSLNEFNLLEQLIQIYPNPATEVVTIKSDAVNVKKIVLYSIMGVEVLFQLNTKPLNISKLEKGIYFIKIETENSGSLGQNYWLINMECYIKFVFIKRFLILIM